MMMSRLTKTTTERSARGFGAASADILDAVVGESVTVSLLPVHASRKAGTWLVPVRLSPVIVIRWSKAVNAHCFLLAFKSSREYFDEYSLSGNGLVHGN